MSFWTSFLVWYATWPWTWREYFGAYFENWFRIWIFRRTVFGVLGILDRFLSYIWNEFEQTVDIHFEWFDRLFWNKFWKPICDFWFFRCMLLRAWYFGPLFVTNIKYFGTNFESTVDIHFECFLMGFGKISWIIFVRTNMFRDARLRIDNQTEQNLKIFFWFYRALHRFKRDFFTLERFFSTENLKRITCCRLFSWLTCFNFSVF